MWVKRVTDVYSKCVWLNPEPEEIWPYRQSIQIVKELTGGQLSRGPPALLDVSAHSGNLGIS